MYNQQVIFYIISIVVLIVLVLKFHIFSYRIRKGHFRISDTTGQDYSSQAESSGPRDHPAYSGTISK